VYNWLAAQPSYKEFDMIKRDTGPARLPALPKVSTGNAQLDQWVSAMAEWREVREGSRGNQAEQVLTRRDLQGIQDAANATQNQLDVLSTAVLGPAPALTAQEAVKRFQDSIRNLQLYKDLVKSLNDPTRFNNLREEVRAVLLRSIADDAKRMQAAIWQEQTKVQNEYLSIAMKVDELTAAVQDAASGVRQTVFATDELGRAQAGFVTQIEAQLDDYYADGQAGIAKVEQSLTATADRVDGLSAQYTLKVQAGGALAGYGIAATEVNGVPSSAFIIMADKFAIVSPNYSGGLTNIPNTNSIPFGVDANGIYMNSNVYLSGSMRIHGGTKTISQGLRGSLQINAGSGSWSDQVASAKVWAALGGTGSPVNTNHLVIGDMVTIGNVTKYWNGSAWTQPGQVITGDLLVDGTISAPKINTNGLVVRDAYGNAILGSGTLLSANWINSIASGQVTGLGSLATQNNVSTSQIIGLGSLATQSNVSTSQIVGLGSIATQNSVTVNQVTGLGALATSSYVSVGNNVRFPDGSTMNTIDFVNKLNKIGTGNINTYIDGAAITQAYIGAAAIGTLQIAGGSVTSMLISNGNYESSNVTVQAGGSSAFGNIYIPGVTGSTGIVLMAFINVIADNDDSGVNMVIRCNGNPINESWAALSLFKGYRAFNGAFAFAGPSLSAYNSTYDVVISQEDPYHNSPIRILSFCLVALGGKR
jgi:hypothetical protein